LSFFFFHVVFFRRAPLPITNDRSDKELIDLRIKTWKRHRAEKLALALALAGLTNPTKSAGHPNADINTNVNAANANTRTNQYQCAGLGKLQAWT
jgi:hypothetical protein